MVLPGLVSLLPLTEGIDLILTPSSERQVRFIRPFPLLTSDESR